MPKLIIAIIIPLLIGAISGFFTSESVSGWYTTLVKPSYNPPNWIFAPVWTTLYILMGIAHYLVWNKPEKQPHVKKTAIIFYFIQLSLNFLWSFLFFNQHQPGWAFIDILLLFGMILLTIIWFRKISPVAAWLLLPYLCWVGFAAILNYSIRTLN
jgi:benzodiazapine receptor